MSLRRSDVAALAALLLGVLLAGLALAIPPAAAVLQGLSGLAILAAIVLALARFLPEQGPHPAVSFRIPGSRERWCTFCGHPAPLAKPCASCGKTTFSMRRNERRLQRKQRPPSQEKKSKN